MELSNAVIECVFIINTESFGRRFATDVAFPQYNYELNGARRNVFQTNMPMYLYAQKRFSLHSIKYYLSTVLRVV
jgi:hypothetical protein